MKNNTETPPKKKSKTILGRLTTASRVGQKTVKIAKTAIKIGLTTLLLATGYYAYKQFKKSPEEIDRETVEMQTRREEYRKGQDPARKINGKMGGKFGAWLRKKAAKRLQD